MTDSPLRPRSSYIPPAGVDPLRSRSSYIPPAGVDPLRPNGDLFFEEDLVRATLPETADVRRGLASAFASAASGHHSGVALKAKAAGDAALEQQALRQADLADRQAGLYAPRVSSLRDAKSIGDVGSFIAGAAPGVVADMLPAVAAALITRGRGRLAAPSALVGAAVPSYHQLFGEMAREQRLDPTLSEASAEDRLRSARLGAAGGTLLEALLPAKLANSALRRPARGLLNHMRRDAETEGLTETAQTGIQQFAHNTVDPTRGYDGWEMLDAGVAGAAGGAGLAGATRAPSHVVNALLDRTRPVAEPLAPAPVAPAAPGQFETILESAKERFGPKVEEAYGTAKDYVSAFAERANEAVKTAETPGDFVRQVFSPSAEEQAQSILQPEHEDPTVLNAADPAAGLADRDARNATSAADLAGQLMDDPATPQFIRDKIDSMGGDYSSKANQAYVASTLLGVKGGKKIVDAVGDFVAFSKELASKAGTIAGDLKTGLTDKVSKKNLQDIHESDVQPLVNLLAKKLGPTGGAQAPQLAKQLIAAANRLSPNGQINEAVDRRLRNFSEAIDDETLDMVTELSGSDALRNSIAKIRAIPSAMSDVRQAAGGSFLESMVTNEEARPLMPQIARAVDELALAGTTAPARASALKALAAGVFGSVKNAQTVVEYYGKMRRSAYKLEAEQAKVREDRDAVGPDMLPGESVATLRNPDGTQGVGTDYNALSEHDADRYEAQYRGINPYRPFFKGTDRKAFAQALKEAGPGARRATLREYLKTTDESPAYVLARIRADLNKRITNAEERDTDTVAAAIKNLESVPAEDRTGPHAELLASLKGRKTETRSDLPTMRRQRDILANALGVSFDDLSNLYRQMADTQSESGVEVTYDNVDSANSQAVAKIRASKSPDELQRMIESYTRRIPHWMTVPGDRAAEVVDAMQYERSVAETRLEALKSGPEGKETRIIRKKLDALEKKLERNIPKALERMAVIVTADSEAVLRGRDTGATTEDVVNKYRSLLDKRRNPVTKRKGEEQEAFEKRKAENESYNAKIAGTRVGFKVKGQKNPLYLSMESMLLNSPVYGSPSERLFAVISDIYARSDVEGMIPPDPNTIVLRRVGAPDLLWRDIAPTGRGAPSKAQINRARAAAEEMVQRRENQKLLDAHTKAGMRAALEKVKYDFLVENLPDKSAVLSGMSLNAVAGLYPRGMDAAMLSAADDVAFESMLGWMDKATKMMRAAQAEADSAKAGLWPEGLKERLLQANSRVRVLEGEILAQLNDRFPMASKAAITDSFADADNEGGMSKGAPTVGGVEPTTQMLYLEERLDVLKGRLEAVSHLVEVAETIRSSIGTVESQIDELADKTSKEMRARPIPGRRTESSGGSGTAVENTTDEKALASLRTRLALLESRRDAAAENDATVAKVGGAVATDVQKASQLLEEQIQSVNDSIKRYEKRPASSVEARRAAREEKAMDARTVITVENVKQAKAQATAMLESGDDAVVDRGHALSNRIRAFEQNLKTQADIKQRNDDARAATGSSAKVVLPNTGPYTAKDQAKSDKANKFIGRGAPGSSTAAYAKAWGDRANTGEYAKNDTVFISVNGNRPGALTPAWDEIKKATSAGATLITDNPSDRARPFNTGERAVAEFLDTNGYVEKSPGTWVRGYDFDNATGTKRYAPLGKREAAAPAKAADYAGIAKPFAKAVGDEAVVADAVSYMEDGAAKTVQKWRADTLGQMEELSQEYEAYNPDTGEYDVAMGVMEGDQKLYDRLNATVEMYDALLKAGGKTASQNRQTTIGDAKKPPNAAEHAELKKKILEEIRRTRGNDVKLRFNRLIKHIGASGEFSMNADKTERLIEIAVNAADPMGVAWHESLHDFFAMLGEDKAGRSIKRDLVNASNAPQVKKRLRELLKDHPEALKQLEESPEERVAYMYQFWATGELKLGPTGNGIFAQIQRLFRDLFRIVGRTERASDLLTALHEGKFADTRVVAEVLADMPRETTNNRMERYAPALKDTMDKLVQTAPDRLRDFQNEHISSLAGRMEKFIQRRNQRDGEWTNKLAGILDGTTATQRRAALENMQAMKPPSSPLEHKLAKFFKDMHGYMTDAKVKTLDSKTKQWVPLREVTNYFPRVFDRAALEKDPDGFVKLLMKHGNMTESSARNTLKALTHGTGQIELAENEHALGFSPYAQAVQDRQLTFIDPSNAAEFAKYQSKDLPDITASYVKQAVHRAEYARDFGNRGEEIAKIVVQSGITDKKDLENINKIVMGLEGTLGYQMSSQTKELFSGILTLQNLVILPLAIFSQVVDPIVLAARSGDLRDAGNAYVTALKKLTRQADVDGEDIAEMLGIISQDTVLEAMGVAYGTTHMSKRMRNINRVFFKYNGMQGWNNAMRIAATAAGERYLLQNKDNEAALKELGLEPSDIKTKVSFMGKPNAQNKVVGKERLDVSDPKVKEAMFKFVDQAVLRPSAANRPVWMSDPKFLLVAHLKQFTFAMHNVVLKRANAQLDDGNPKPWLILALAMPTILAADMAKFALTGGAPPGWGFKEFLGHAVERSGLLGLGDFGAQATQGVGQGKMPGEALLGPSFEHLMELLRFLLGAPGVDSTGVIDRTVPGARFV